MIPLSTFNVLLVVVVLLVIYAWVDYRNKLYGNIAAAILASFISIIMAIVMYLGAVSTDAGAPINDTPSAGIMLLIGVTITLYAFYMVWDAKDEYERDLENAP